jgi:hypothetical protein
MAPPQTAAREALALPFGIAAGGIPVALPVAGPEPHLLVTGRAGQGVTTTLTVLAREAAVAGVEVRACVRDEDSVLAARLRGTGGVTIAAGFGDSAALIEDTGALVLHRYTCLQHDHAAGWPPVILIADDFHDLAAAARRRAPGSPARPPAVLDAAAYIAACGRAARTTLIVGTHGIAPDSMFLDLIGTRAALGPLSRQERIRLAGTAAAAGPDRLPGSGFVTDGTTWTAFRARNLPANPAK